jgi:hypothetical protein
MAGLAGIFNITSLIIIAILSIPFTFGLLIPVYWLLVFYGAKKRIGKAGVKLNETLMQSETLLATGIQQRSLALFSRRKVVGITDSRIIVISRGIFGGFSMRDFQWKDLRDAQISENVLSGICGSNLTFHGVNESFFVPGVENDAAMLIYQKAQSEEQAWEEKRRVRDLEEKRAMAGGVIVNSGASQSNHESTSRDSSSVMEEIEKAKKLLDSGAVSDAEFNEIKSKILAKSF